MTPEELAKRHPRLYHVTESGAWENICRLGLLATSRLLDVFEITGEARKTLETKRRGQSIMLRHPTWGTAILNDQVPLNEGALSKCLQDALTPVEWLKILNARVFFWTEKKDLDKLLNARLNRTRGREVLVVDTLSLARTYSERIEISPINSGVTLRKAALRGKETFSPLLKYSYDEWRGRRGKRDTIKELTVLEHVPDIRQHTIEVIQVFPGTRISS